MDEGREARAPSARGRQDRAEMARIFDALPAPKGAVP
jgi:hypothetical protein